MRQTLTEEKVLKKLNIVDFRHLTKDKVLGMASMLDKMDPEVAKKAIEQFPEFSSTTKSIFADYKGTIEKSLESNDKSLSSVYASCDVIIENCQKILESENLSFDEKKYILAEMVEISKYKGMKDTENKKHTTQIAGITGLVALAFAGLLCTILGGKADIDLRKLGKSSKDKAA